MNWFKKIEYYLFPQRKEDTEIKEHIQESKESSSEPKNISEPIISFLKIFEDNPRRFKIVVVDVHSWGYTSYNFIDTFNSETWCFTRWLGSYSGHTYSLPDFITEDEKSSIVEKLESYYLGRRKQLTKLKEYRKQRALNKERDRLTKIYREEG